MSHNRYHYRVVISPSPRLPFPGGAGRWQASGSGSSVCSNHLLAPVCYRSSSRLLGGTGLGWVTPDHAFQPPPPAHTSLAYKVSDQNPVPGQVGSLQAGLSLGAGQGALWGAQKRGKEACFPHFSLSFSGSLSSFLSLPFRVGPCPPITHPGYHVHRIRI